MNGQIPVWIPLLMAASAVFSAGMLVWSAAASGAGSRKVIGLAFAALAILTIHGAAAASGFYVTTANQAPKIAIAAPTTIIILLVFVFAAMPKGDSPLKLLTILHTVRIPVEIVLWQLFLYGSVPRIMTFESINLDVLSGLTAPFAAWIGFAGGRVRRKFLIVWNFAALALLANIVFHAVLSVPSPIQRYGFEQPNIAVLHFPYVWLPAFIVPAVLAAHVWCLRELFRKE